MVLLFAKNARGKNKYLMKTETEKITKTIIYFYSVFLIKIHW